jgi:hypothetical protein
VGPDTFGNENGKEMIYQVVNLCTCRRGDEIWQYFEDIVGGVTRQAFIYDIETARAIWMEKLGSRQVKIARDTYALQGLHRKHSRRCSGKWNTCESVLACIPCFHRQAPAGEGC